MPSTVSVPISTGELVDKITILEIKNEMIADPAKLANVAKELELLRHVRRELGIDDSAAGPAVAVAEAALKEVNTQLWNAEDTIRDFDRRGDFGEGFVAVARSIYRLNDQRAARKRDINMACGSEIVEDKGYAAY